MSAFYGHVDHRAPGYMPHNTSPTFVLTTAYFGGIALGVIVLALTPTAIVTQNLIVAALAIAAWAALIRWIQLCDRFIIRVEDMPDNGHFRIQEHVAEMQLALRRHPELRDVIEPVLVAAYDCTRAGDEGGVATRRTAIRDLVAEVKQDRIDSNTEDVDDLRRFLEVRREMRRDGLL